MKKVKFFQGLVLFSVMSVSLTGCFSSDSENEDTDNEQNTETQNGVDQDTQNREREGENEAGDRDRVSQEADEASDPEEVIELISLAELSTHDSVDDCWLSIEDQVFDVTDFVVNHPGKEEILKGCGIDSTGLFTGSDPSGRDHSSFAEDLLKNESIGIKFIGKLEA